MFVEGYREGYPYDVTVSRLENEGFGFVIISSVSRAGSTIGRIIPGSLAWWKSSSLTPSICFRIPSGAVWAVAGWWPHPGGQPRGHQLPPSRGHRQPHQGERLQRHAHRRTSYRWGLTLYTPYISIIEFKFYPAKVERLGKGKMDVAWIVPPSNPKPQFYAKLTFFFFQTTLPVQPQPPTEWVDTSWLTILQHFSIKIWNKKFHTIMLQSSRAVHVNLDFVCIAISWRKKAWSEI